ncbi:fatty-acid amide hydrolase 2-B [Nomia melanderi]|uniref:fatty-acid amide hydrolase 2-B n=1 Tax=Nomia melanderi TaxID=2448451 RepID=UPI0013047976|nr:fatty-acid amide hydrolase 2-B [Nomia melanderi]XP_031844645.1 fatty-acid amide hydrolase 2-B [Nomia melanderi]XP_031844646.1 fatty-acid amide hydrolase 2-B [Nomia melanderi]XP_031844648.1 fatty-acid amide hydrolase 2-B [Nomia melanderi]XP_031844649.1 fatty-acid amide hydrolase 2-B [Nomia melanderi]
MSTKNKNQNKMQSKRHILSTVHRLLELILRQIYLFFAFLTGPAQQQPPIKDLVLLNSATALACKIRNKQLTSESVIQSYIDRIKEIQPVLNCVVEDRFENALKEAKKCDELLASENAPSPQVLAEQKPFFGVPFTTKDCIGIANMKQTAGLVARKNAVAEKDAEVIRLMRAAGAIPLATTNVSELAMWWETNNCLYGITKNPYNTRYIVGGSSGGEGCIQAAAGSPLGIGSDIGGSIRMPCFFNGIFGHKPSKNIVSNDGQYPSTHSEDQDKLLAIGPMCRYAQDLKPILKVLANENAKLLHLNENVDISKLKFYYMEDDGGQYLTSPVDLEIKKAIREVIRYLEIAHKIKATKLNIKKLKKSINLWTANMSCKDERDFAYELTNRTGRINICWEFLKWITFTSNHTLIALFTAMFERFMVKYGTEKHTKLIEESKDLSKEFQDILGEDGVFFYPTHPTAAPMHFEPLIKPFNFSYTAIFNVLGLPVTNCPLGLNSQGLPIGIQIIGGLNQDHLTIAVAEVLERRFGGWVSPAILA